jgi:hypothetical protein
VYGDLGARQHRQLRPSVWKLLWSQKVLSLLSKRVGNKSELARIQLSVRLLSWSHGFYGMNWESRKEPPSLYNIELMGNMASAYVIQEPASWVVKCGGRQIGTQKWRREIITPLAQYRTPLLQLVDMVTRQNALSSAVLLACG